MNKTGTQGEKTPHRLEQQMRTLLEHIEKEAVPDEMQKLARELQAALERRTREN